MDTQGNTQSQESMDGSSPLVQEPFIDIKFQLGPIQEVGVNGTTIERVLELLKIRLGGFQQGPFRCSLMRMLCYGPIRSHREAVLLS